jgi:hypothetical protein
VLFWLALLNKAHIKHLLLDKHHLLYSELQTIPFSPHTLSLTHSLSLSLSLFSHAYGRLHHALREPNSIKRNIPTHHLTMRYSHFLSSAATLLAGVSAHTWVEQLMNVADDGSYYGTPGYIRNYIERTDPNFGDAKLSWLSPQGSRPRLSNADMLCHTNQRTAVKSEKWPSLATARGNTVALRYLENGHVTLPDNQKGKPASGGLVYIYATSNPKPDETLANVLQWNTEGSLENGRLLNINKYDDGRCYQVNGAAAISVARQAEFPNSPDGGGNRELWCQNVVQIPQDAPESLTMYWVWQWPTQPGIDPGLPTGKDEIYTSCMDLNIVADDAVLKSAVGGADLGAFQDQTPALPDFKQRLANTTLPESPVFYGPGSTFGGSPPANPPANNPGNFAPRPTTLQTSAAPAPTQAPGGQQPGVVYITLTSTQFSTVTVYEGAPTGRPDAGQGGQQDGSLGDRPTDGQQGPPNNGQQGPPNNGQQGPPNNGGQGRPSRGKSAKFR